MVTLSQKQLQRVQVIENLVEGRIGVGRAAELLGRSPRQVMRLQKKYQKGEVDWVYHGNRGKAASNKIDEQTRQRVLELAQGKYRGFNDSHLHEKLVREEKMDVSRQSVRRILRRAGRPSPQKRRARQYRARRERRAQEGMMLQGDGSRHDWLEGRGPSLTLLGFIDDATGRVPVARFQAAAEDAAGYLRVLRKLVEEKGIPCSLYRDQHSTFQRNDDHWSIEEQLQGRQFPTQVGRALEELGITSIAARSPQAKGRIERLWRTFQDRLVSELRLAGVGTLEQANAVLERFLGEFNERFAQPARDSQVAYRHRDRRLDLDYICSLRYERTVNPDHTVAALPGLTVQLPALAGQRGYAGKKVEVCQQPNGDLKFYLNRSLLHVEPAPPDAGPVRAQPQKRRSGPRKKKPLPIYNYAGRPALAVRP